MWHSATAAEHVAEFVYRFAGGRKRCGERIPLIGLGVVGLAGPSVLVDITEVDDALETTCVSCHFVEFRGFGVVLFNKVSHIVEGT